MIMEGYKVQSIAPAPQAHRPKVGESIRAPNLDKTHLAVTDLSTVIAEAVQDPEPQRTIEGFIAVLGITGFGSAGTGIILCRVLEDLQPVPQQYQVLMPPTLYETLRGTVSYVYTTEQTRTATEAAVNETQYLQPSYVAGDVITCALLRGVWFDLNLDGRQWVADP